MLKLLIYFYVFFISFTGAFALGEWAKLHVVLVSIIIPLSFVYISKKKTINIKCYKPEDLFIILMFIGLSLSSLISPNQKSFNYLLAYFFIFGASYLILKGVICNYCNYRKLLNVNTLSVIFVSSFAIIDFIGFYYFNFDIQSIIPRSRDASATYLGIFRRSYGFATEPTILALYFNTLGILAVWNLWKYMKCCNVAKFLFTLIFIGAWMSTFSAAGVASLLAGFLISFSSLWLRVQKVHIYKRHLMLLILAMLILSTFSFSFRGEIKSFTAPIIRKITLQKGASVRMEQWRRGLSDIIENPVFGYGPGNTSVSGSVSNINWYIFLTVEGGLVSSLPIILFLIFSYIRIASSKVTGKIWFMTGFIAGSIHFMAISTFFHPFLWFFLIIFFLCKQSSLTDRNGIIISSSNKIIVKKELGIV